MVRALRAVVVGALLLALVAIAAVNLLAPPAAPDAPDPALLVTRPDGSTIPLRAFVERASASATEPGEPSRPGPDPELALPEVTDGLLLEDLGDGRWRVRHDPDDVFGLAEIRREAGDLEQALALYRSVPAAHERYATAQRRIGWELLAKQRGEPRLGVRYVNASVAADPLSGNAWQDAARVYLASLGLPVD